MVEYVALVSIVLLIMAVFLVWISDGGTSEGVLGMAFGMLFSIVILILIGTNQKRENKRTLLLKQYIEYRSDGKLVGNAKDSILFNWGGVRVDTLLRSGDE